MTFKLLATIEQAFSKLHKGGNDHPLPQQLTFELPKNRPFLSGSSLQALYPQACFFNREGRKFWGVGALKRYNSRSELANGIKQLNRDKETTDQWIIGGRSFTGLPTSSSEWREYGEYLFFLPRFALEQDSNGQGHLTINFQDETVAILPRLYEQLTTLLTSNPTATMPNSTRLEYLPGQEEFEQLVNQGVDQIIQNKLQKYVLARKVVKDFDAPIPYDSVVQQLMEQKRPGSYLLFIAPSPQSCFISQTPEQLFSLNDDHLLTEALAGSRPAGRSPQADQQLGAELLDSAKDATEHQLVNQHLDMVLAKFCHSHRSVAKRELLNLGYIQHLRTRWEGRVIKHFNLLDFLDQI
ncbi:MAG: hypothetical protein HN730_03890, partial [Bdellovibrionales bacterium]|nr:hypothetical protein [Bdellovibrionales bacterium]